MAAKLLINMAVNPQLKKLQSLVEEYQQKLCLSDVKERLVRDHAFGVFNFVNERFEIQRLLTSMQASSDTCNSWDDILGVIGTVMKKRETGLSSPFHSMLAKCIDKVKHASSDWTLKGIVSRLEMLSQEIGLQFDSGHTGTHCFISSDMFYVEVQLDSSANILDVKVQGHSGDPRSSPELLKVLRDQDFLQFRTHLEGFAKLYRLQGNGIIKSKILTALEALEADIHTLSKVDREIAKIGDSIQTGNVGYVIPRIGGHSMQLMYCCNPITISNQDQSNTKVEVLCQDSYIVSVSVESSELRQLASSTIVTKTGNQTPQFSKLDSNNSEKLPASFCLLNKDHLPLALPLAAELHEIIHAENKFSTKTDYPLDQLIIRQHNLMRKGADLSKGNTFNSMLPDQEHCYRWIPAKQQSCMGLLFSRIQFQHPDQVPKIIQILRRQAMFNTLLKSCFSKDMTCDKDETICHHFEFVMTSYNSMSVVFRHPIHPTLATVEFTVRNDCTVTSSLRVFTGAPLFCSSSLINRVVQKCLSIPITMRFLMNQSLSYVPGSIPEPSGARTLRRTEKKSIKLDRLKLNLGPHFGSQETGSMPLVSPGVYSVANIDHNRMMSPSSATLAFSYVDLLSGSDSAESPNRSDSSSRSSSKKRSADEKKLKPLPKITLKRKRDRNEYEIDKAKSTLDDLGPSDIATNEVTDNDVDNDTMSFVYSQFGGNAIAAAASDYDKGSSLVKDLDLTFSTATLPFEIPMDALSSSAINVNSVEGLQGLVLSGHDIDHVSLMGGILPGELSLQGTTSHLEPFDLDSLSAGGAPLDFGVDDSMNSVSTSMIDPSAVVSTSAGMNFGQRLDVSDLMLDTMGDNPLDNM